MYGIYINRLTCLYTPSIYVFINSFTSRHTLINMYINTYSRKSTTMVVKAGGQLRPYPQNKALYLIWTPCTWCGNAGEAQ